MPQYIDYNKSHWAAGFSSPLFEIANNSALTTESLQNIDNQTGNGLVTKSTITVISSEDEISSKLTASAEASGIVFGATVGGSLQFLQESDITATSVMMICDVQVLSSVQTLAQPVLQSGITTDPKTFYEMYGDYYLSELDLGGRFTLFFLFSTTDMTSKNELAATLKGKMGEWSSSTEAAKKMTQSSSLSSLKLSYYQAGGSTTPTSRDVDYLIDFVMNFPNTVSTSNSVVYQAGIAPYASYFPALGKWLQGPYKNLSALGNTLGNYQDLLNDVEWALARGDYDLGSDVTQELKKLQGDMKDDIATIEGAWKQQNASKIPSVSHLNLKHTPGEYETKWSAINITALAVVQFGQQLHMKGKAGYITKFVQQGIKGEYYPQVAEQDAVVLKIQGGAGQVASGQTVNIQTTESGVTKYDLMGAWTDTHVYYYSSGYTNENWTITKQDTEQDKVIRYGDWVSLTSQSYKGQYLQPHGVANDALLTTSVSPYFWKFERAS